MRTSIKFTVMACLATTVLLFCGKKENTVTIPETNDRVVGTWSFSSALLPDSTRLALIVKNENRYTLAVTQMNDKTLFNSDGAWSATEDSITLTGEQCTLYDTTTSQMVPLDETTCSTPLILPFPESDTTWTIRTSNFSAALSSLPIPQAQLQTVYSFFQTITLAREE